MAEIAERLVATLEADIRNFSKNMLQAQREFDQRADAIERRQTTMVGRINNSFGRMNLNSLISRYASWGAVIAGTRRLVSESIEVNEQAAASWARLEETISRLADLAGPAVASFFDQINETIQRDIRDIEKLIGLWERLKSVFVDTRTGTNLTIPLTPHPFNDFAQFNRGTRNWMTAPGGFPEPGVRDVTPPRPGDDQFARMYNESMNQLAAQLYDQFQRDRESAAEAASEHFLQFRPQGGKSILTGLTIEEMDALEEFHADAKAAWDAYYEGLADAADEAATMDAQRITEKIANIGDAFQYLGEAALHGGEAFKRALQDMVASLAASGLRELFQSLLTSLVDGGGFLGRVISGARASGGPVQAGRAYVVGEKRPELFVPSTSGTIIPRIPNAVAGGRSITMNFVNNNSFAGAVDANSIKAYADQVGMVSAQAAVAQVRKQFPGMMIKAQRDHL